MPLICGFNTRLNHPANFQVLRTYHIIVPPTSPITNLISKDLLVPCGGKGQKAPPKIEDHTVLFGPFFNFGVFSDLSTLPDSLKPP